MSQKKTYVISYKNVKSIHLDWIQQDIFDKETGVLQKQKAHKILIGDRRIK